MTEKDKIKKEIQDSKARLKELEEQEKGIIKNLAIKKLEEYTDVEKINFFDKLYSNAKSELDELEDSGYSREDNKDYAWEEYIVILSKNYKAFWEYWNSLSK